MSVIQPATPDDLPQLADLLAELFALEPEFKPDRARQLSGLRAILEHPDVGLIFVAREGSRIDGMLSLLFTISTAEGGRVAILEDFIVRAGARGRGLGTQLLDHALGFVKASGLTRVTLTTNHDNVRAQRLYQKHGFQPSTMMTMRLHLK